MQFSKTSSVGISHVFFVDGIRSKRVKLKFRMKKVSRVSFDEL